MDRDWRRRIGLALTSLLLAGALAIGLSAVPDQLPGAAPSAQAAWSPDATPVPMSSPSSPHATPDDALKQRVRAELRELTEWLAAHRVDGFVGEFGWPDDVQGDARRWNGVADAWLTDADAAGLWATAWAAGEWWVWDPYNLAIYESSQRGGPVDSPNTQAAVLEAHPSTDRYRRGVNVAGGAFSAPAVDLTSAFSNANPGAVDVQYHYDGQQTFDYLASRGHQFARIEFRWERVQPTPGGPLDAGELARLKAVVGRAGTAGLSVVLDVHNYGAYYLANGGQGVRQPIGSAAVSVEQFADLWRRLSEAFADDPAVVAYGLMNEPTDLAGEHTPFGTLYTWDERRWPWVADNFGPETLAHDTQLRRNGAGSLRVRKWLGGGYQQLRVHDDRAGTGQLRDLHERGSTLATWVYLPASTAGRGWRASLFLYDHDWAHHVDAASPGLPLTPGQWTQVTATFPEASLRSVNAVGVQVSGHDPNAEVTVYLDDFTQGDGASPARVWERASQAAVDAIRARGDDTLVMVPGYDYSKVQRWGARHPEPWIVDPVNRVRYEAHHYWDGDTSSQYARSYEQELRIVLEAANGAR